MTPEDRHLLEVAADFVKGQGEEGLGEALMALSRKPIVLAIGGPVRIRMEDRRGRGAVEADWLVHRFEVTPREERDESLWPSLYYAPPVRWHDATIEMRSAGMVISEAPIAPPTPATSSAAARPRR